MKARTTAALAVLAVAALALGGVSVAQQAGGPRSQSANSVQGSSGGGASSVANRGGAAGVPNPDPGGGPAQDGESSGPQGTAARRSGYLGGRDAPADGDGGTVVISAPPVGENRPTCHDARPGGMSPSARLSGPNMGRINQVRALLGPAGRSGRASSRYLLANLQEELAKMAPDLELAATYLGIAATAPLSPQLVLRASELLCVPLSLEQASSLSAIAEAERLRLETDFR